MNYKETTEYLFVKLPEFQKVGKDAYKPGMENMVAFDKKMNSCHRHYKTIHVAGTNGKGSTSHLLAAILQSAGYKVGLYTSPHLIDYRERVRVNGEMMSEEYVVDFVEKYRSMIEDLRPSFFEITTVMAFEYFAQQKVDIAVIEVGLGGRLDSTNVISPILSVITNISHDHINLLGNTLEKIAVEKAGIIKRQTPVVIGRAKGKVKDVFLKKALEQKAPIYFANENNPVRMANKEEELYISSNYCKHLRSELRGVYQKENSQTVLCAVEQLKKQGLRISEENVRNGFASVIELTGLQGRWQTLSENPRVICDTGHNEDGIRFVVKQLQDTPKKVLRIVFGMVKDKDISKVLSLMPKNAVYYFTQAQSSRALKAEEMKAKAFEFGLLGNAYSTVTQALEQAKKDYEQGDLIFVGGSNFIVCEVL